MCLIPFVPQFKTEYNVLWLIRLKIKPQEKNANHLITIMTFGSFILYLIGFSFPTQ